MIAALYVSPLGPYCGREGIDFWDESRDARNYRGPYPVIAHPPCARWGRYWSGGPSARVRRELGDDGGCFEAALQAVRKWGGVIEHPEASHAWRYFCLARPPKSGGWIQADFRGGWTCCVEQGHYGHPARKATWLYVWGVRKQDLPELKWGKCRGRRLLDAGYKSAEDRRRSKARGCTKDVNKLSPKEMLVTPEPFAEVLIRIANSVCAENLAIPRSSSCG
jgi:hypothetical protein